MWCHQTCQQLLHFVCSSQVLSVGKLYNPDVRYSFNIPIEDKPQQFYWNSHGPWQACSKPCQGIYFSVEFWGFEGFFLILFIYFSLEAAKCM